MEENSIEEKRDKDIEKLVSIATLFSIGVTALSLIAGYLIVWKYLSNNNELWFFPIIMSDYGFQIFAFGFGLAFFILLMPFFLGIVSGGIIKSSEINDNRIIFAHIIFDCIIIDSLFIFILFKMLINNYINILLFFLLLLIEFFFSRVTLLIMMFLIFKTFKIKKIMDELSIILKDIRTKLKEMFPMILFQIFSIIVFFPAFFGSKIFNELSDNAYKNIFILYLLFLLPLLINFIGILLNIFVLRKTINEKNNNFLNYFYKIAIVGVFSIPIILFFLSPLFNIPRIVIVGIGLGGKYYSFKFNDITDYPYFINDKKFCMFIQTKHSFYVTLKKGFCASNTSNGPVGTLIRISKKDVISVTPE
jgi:hypothetical protein